MTSPHLFFPLFPSIYSVHMLGRFPREHSKIATRNTVPGKFTRAASQRGSASPSGALRNCWAEAAESPTRDTAPARRTVGGAPFLSGSHARNEGGQGAGDGVPVKASVPTHSEPAGRRRPLCFICTLDFIHPEWIRVVWFDVKHFPSRLGGRFTLGVPNAASCPQSRGSWTRGRSTGAAPMRLAEAARSLH